MKTLTLFLVVTFGISLNCISQTVNDIPIRDIDLEYVQIVETSNAFTNKKSIIEIDFGHEGKQWESNDTQVKDENGKPMEFNSMIDALNFMERSGYEFVAAYVFNNGSQNVLHYLLKKG